MTHVTLLEDRSLLHISGADALAFLQGLLTQDMARITPGQNLWAGLLSPQGKALFEMLVHGAPDGSFWLDVAKDKAEALAQRLHLYRLRRQVEIAPAPSSLKIWALWGGDHGSYPADGRLPALGARWIDDQPHIPNADLAAYHRHRRLLGVPQAEEIGQDQTLWLETNAAELNGVSFTKGCYVGQENTARMHHRDKIRRRILPLHLQASPKDDEVIAHGKSAGMLRGYGDGVALAWLRLELVNDAREIYAGSVSAELIWPTWLEKA